MKWPMSSAPFWHLSAGAGRVLRGTHEWHSCAISPQLIQNIRSSAGVHSRVPAPHPDPTPLAIGLFQEAGRVEYWGFDANALWIAWCRKHIEPRHPSYRFIHVDVANELYNPTGATLGDRFRFPLADAHADIVYMWGVFTNMR